MSWHRNFSIKTSKNIGYAFNLRILSGRFYLFIFFPFLLPAPPLLLFLETGSGYLAQGCLETLGSTDAAPQPPKCGRLSSPLTDPLFQGLPLFFCWIIFISALYLFLFSACFNISLFFYLLSLRLLQVFLLC